MIIRNETYIGGNLHWMHGNEYGLFDIKCADETTPCEKTDKWGYPIVFTGKYEECLKWLEDAWITYEGSIRG